MIHTFAIQNFKCLLDVKVDLGPFTVLIGPNDSGKTSFLDALYLLGQSVKTQQPQGSGLLKNCSELIWQKKTDRNIVLNVAGKASKPFEYRLEKSAFGRPRESLRIDNIRLFDDPEKLVEYNSKKIHVSSDLHQTLLCQFADVERNKNNFQDPLLAVAETLGSTEEYQLNPAEMVSPGQVQPHPFLNRSGKNLTTVLHAFLTGPDRQAVVTLEEKLHEAIPSLKGLATPPASGLATVQAKRGRDQFTLEFTLNVDTKPPITIPAFQASAGAILIAAFLVLAYGETPHILLIEEPENGLHPSQLRRVIDLLRKMSTGEVGNQARQIIVTTHSPLLLNFVQPEEVRIFKRDERGATQVTPMDQIPNLDRLRKEFAPGELWYLFGEEEMLKGSPA